MGFIEDTYDTIAGNDSDADKSNKKVDEYLGSATGQTVDMFNESDRGRFDKLVDGSAYAPITGAAQWGADQAKAGAARQMGRMASGGGGGYNPAMQRAAGNAYADASGQIAQQAIGGRLQEEGMNRQLADAYNQRRVDQQKLQVNALSDAARTKAGLASGQEAAAAQREGAVYGAVGTGISAMSDVRAKQDVQPGMGSVEEMLDKLDPVDFRYKPGMEDGGAKPHTGVMAQDLAASQAGRSAVVQNPQSGMLGIDAAQAAPLALATASNLHQRLKAVEQGDGQMALPDDAIQREGMPADERELAAIEALKRRG